MNKTAVLRRGFPATKFVSILLLFVIGLGLYVYWRWQAPLPLLQPQRIAVSESSGSSSPITWPTSGQSALGIIGHGVLASNGAQTPAPTASVAKLITALSVLQTKPITVGTQGPLITITPADEALYQSYASQGGSVAAVAVNEKISEYQLLQGMLLPSANNMADTLAIWAFGSLGAYQQHANNLVMKLGMHQTHVGTDASGFNPSTTSTASDLIKLGEVASKNTTISGIGIQKTATLPVAGTVKNVNWLLGTAGINGLKTGNSNQDAGVYVFSAPYMVAKNKSITIIGAIMQSASLQSAMDSSLPLLASAQKATAFIPVYSAANVFARYSVPWQSTVEAINQQAVSALAWQGIPLNNPLISVQAIQPPLPNGAIVGTISYPEDLKSNNSRFILSGTIQKPSIWWKLSHP